jgi:hypothetical protein
MNAALQHLTENWKSTLQSILTTTFALTGTLMLSSVIKPHTAAILVAVNGVCKVLLGVFQTDGVQVPAGSTIKQTSTITTPSSANPTQTQEKN